MIKKGANLFSLIALFVLGPVTNVWPQSHTEVLEVRYAQRTIGADLSDYEKHWQSVLELALQKSGTPYRLTPVSGKGLTHARIMRSVNQDGLVNVAYMGTSKEFEKRLRPIRIPVFRGLIGYRILMIRKADQTAFSAVTRFEDVTNFSIGLGIKWSDVEIMEKAGLKIVQVPYGSLFKALQAGRFDAISRAAYEIEPELRIVRKNYPDLAAEQSLILAFRQASFFFVAKKNKRLAEAIETGLLNAYEDGSFMALFNSSPVVKRAREILHEKERRLFWFKNISLSEETRNIPARFWFDLKN